MEIFPRGWRRLGVRVHSYQHEQRNDVLLRFSRAKTFPAIYAARRRGEISAHVRQAFRPAQIHSLQHHGIGNKPNLKPQGNWTVESKLH